ncbi:hypothetical protein J4E90_001496 [Alternaria incomplexa]|uniref:uncharacterized protein n=1 Tax=Alternaria incomplexa TaxID=1187928 RepID=UPI00221F4859|nr:uncharacterized protein J4E90_001496 [Alternaria incomplexa]KAI4919363.1 hypothetical protein J4E90_001496 [Alternaria incomplexa]
MANSVYKDYINLPAHTDLLSKILNLGISMFPMPVPQQVDPNLRTKDLIETAKTWETSEKRRYFLASLHEAWMATPVKNIRKIVAFGLGPLYTEEAEASPDDLGRYDLGLNKYHTLLVFDMAHMLANKFKNPVPIIFQDVNCNQQDRDWLAEYAKHKDIEMRFLEDPHALLEVDKYTLVLAHGLPGFNVRSVIVDITKREGGPAGFFCENIPQFTTTEEELKAATQFPVDPPSRRIDSMVEYYGMRSMCGIHEWQVELYLKPQKV